MSMATLDTYRQKRNFKSTSEPRGRNPFARKLTAEEARQARYV